MLFLCQSFMNKKKVIKSLTAFHRVKLEIATQGKTFKWQEEIEKWKRKIDWNERWEKRREDMEFIWEFKYRRLP